MIFVATVAMAQTPCPEATSVMRLRLQVESTMAAFAEFDEEDLSTNATTLSASVPCLDRIIAPDLAARVHLALAVRHWTLNKEGPWPGHLCAIRRLVPDFELSTDLFPEDHRFRIALEASRCDALEERPLDVPEAFVDGRATVPISPVPFPYLAQHQQEQGVVGRWVDRGEAFPFEGSGRRRTTSKVLTVGGVSVAALGSALLTGSVLGANRYACLGLAPDARAPGCPDPQEAQAFRKGTLVPLNVTGWSLLGAGVALGVTGAARLGGDP